MKFNRKAVRDYGISLPVGRHSIINGIAISIIAKDQEREDGVQRLLDFLKGAGDLSDWGLLQARSLFESVAVWRDRTLIPRPEWEERFHVSMVKATIRSAEAFKGYLGIRSLSNSHKKSELGNIN